MILLEIIKAVFFAGLPIAIISYYLITITSKKIKFKAKNPTQLKKELKGVTFVKDKKDNIMQQMIHKKFLKFGGGFYGIMVFISYIHIEIMQIIDFIRDFSSWQNFLDSIGFSMLFGFLFDAVANLVRAFLWPLYWYKYLPIGSFWVWIIIAIVAHTIATRYALFKVSTTKVN